MWFGLKPIKVEFYNPRPKGRGYYESRSFVHSADFLLML